MYSSIDISPFYANFTKKYHFLKHIVVQICHEVMQTSHNNRQRGFYSDILSKEGAPDPSVRFLINSK